MRVNYMVIDFLKIKNLVETNYPPDFSTTSITLWLWLFKLKLKQAIVYEL